LVLPLPKAHGVTGLEPISQSATLGTAAPDLLERAFETKR
jgi:hypothetical protein